MTTWGGLEFSGVGRSFAAGGRQREVLTGIDLSVDPGEVIAILGPRRWSTGCPWSGSAASPGTARGSSPAAIGAFLPVCTTVSAALAHIDPHLVEVGRAYGRSDVMLLAIVLLAGLGKLSDTLLSLAERRLPTSRTS